MYLITSDLSHTHTSISDIYIPALLVNPERLQWTPLYNVADPTKDKWSIKAKKESFR